MCARPLAGLDLRSVVFRRSLQDRQDRFPLVAWRTAVLLNEFAVFFSCSCFLGFVCFSVFATFVFYLCFPGLDAFASANHFGDCSVLLSLGFFSCCARFVCLCVFGLGNFSVCSIWQFVAHLPVGITSIAFLSHGLHSNYN